MQRKRRRATAHCMPTKACSPDGTHSKFAETEAMMP